MSGEPVPYSLYIYAPNKIAPIPFAGIFAISAAFHIWQCIHHRSFRVTGWHPVAAVALMAGYALRSYSAQDNFLYEDDDIQPLLVYIMSQIFIFICPPILELANYHVLARVCYYVPHCSPLAPGRILAIFGGLVALIEILNGIGVSLSANPSGSPTTQDLGKNMSIAALALQVAVIMVFVGLASSFHSRFVRSQISSNAVRTVMLTLYASMALIFSRCVFRLVEYTGNTKIDISDPVASRRLTPLLRYEAYFYAFEASLILCNSILWNIWSPGRLLPRDYHFYLARDGTEVTGKEQVDNRPGWAKLGHVVTFGVFFRRRDEIYNNDGVGEAMPLSSNVIVR